MPEAMQARRCVATTPSLGVRLEITRGESTGSTGQAMVGLQAANEGGRGTARASVLVPVKRGLDGRIEPAMNLDEFLDPKAGQKGGVLDLQWRSNQTTLPTPFRLRWYGDQWRQITATTDLVLMLMIFQDLRVAQTNPAPVPDGVAALKHFFGVLRDLPAAQHAARVRRGLVQLAAADIPNSVQPPDTDAPAQGKAPAQAAAAFTLVLASCQYPAGLVDGTPQRFGLDASPAGPADASMLRLAARLNDETLDDTHRPSLLLLTGDQIYADATAGLFDPRAGATPQVRSSIRQAENWLRMPYQNWLGSVGPQSVLGRVSSQMLLDDHEIDDNWEPPPLPARPGEEGRMQRLMEAGSHAHQRYTRNLYEAILLPQLWDQHCTHRGIRLFLADTRTERGARSAAQDPSAASIMGSNQMHALMHWLSAEPHQPAFIVSASTLLPRRRRSAHKHSTQATLRSAIHSDAWDGYPGSLHRMLVAVWRCGRSNLVFLSGDEHLSSVIRATVTRCGEPDRAVTLHSVHSSGLYAPYPFANAVGALFALPDDWTFDDPDQPGAQYRCIVEPCAPWVPGDGFALLRLAPPEHETPPAAWQLHVCFDRAQSDACQPLALTLAAGPGPLQPPLA